MRPLLRTASLVLAAYLTSELVYWRGVVPRLPYVQHVPLAWWLAVYAPLGLGAAAAGTRLSGKHEIPLHACVAACIPLGVPLLWSLLDAAWSGRETGVRDLLHWSPTLWGILAGGFAIIAAVFAAAIAFGYLAARTWRR